MGRFSISSSVADATKIVRDGVYRFTVISDRIIRIEKSLTSTFEDSPTQVILFRDYAKPVFNCEKNQDKVLIKTKCTIFEYDKTKDKPYIICGDKKIDASKNKGNLKGTLRTLDFTAGAVPLQNGIFAKNGVVMLDDSSSYIIDEEGNVKKRGKRYLHI